METHLFAFAPVAAPAAPPQHSLRHRCRPSRGHALGRPPPPAPQRVNLRPLRALHCGLAAESRSHRGRALRPLSSPRPRPRLPQQQPRSYRHYLAIGRSRYATAAPSAPVDAPPAASPAVSPTEGSEAERLHIAYAAAHQSDRRCSRIHPLPACIALARSVRSAAADTPSDRAPTAAPDTPAAPSAPPPAAPSLFTYISSVVRSSARVFSF